ncbi:MAG: hypothetical protein HN348_25770, partial [Proteobacteria bacterium]|nr:hypothetical protein [Pseudomonadota bacterium]
GATCQCDDLCELHGDCCRDYSNECPSDTGPVVEDTATPSRNSPPEILQVITSPERALENDLFVLCDAIVYDEDTLEEDITVDFLWYNWADGTPLASGKALNIGGLNRGDAVACVATPFDGIDFGTTATAVVLKNSLPTISQLKVTPSTLTHGASALCHATTDDADGDGVSIDYWWENKNGTLIGNGSTLDVGNALDNGDINRGEDLFCHADIWDGYEYGEYEGGVENSNFALINTPPVASNPALDSDPIVTTINTDLQCSANSSDDESHTVTLAYVWKDGNGMSIGTGTSLNVATLFNNGTLVEDETITCEITPNDTFEDGSVKTVSTAVNQLPLAYNLALDANPVLTTDADLVCSASSSDGNSDSVTLTYVWKDGADIQIGIGKNLDVAALFNNGTLAEGETVTCEVTPNDTREDGITQTVATSLNNRPTVSNVVLSQTPIVATTNSTLTCSATDGDTDGDTVTLSYVWKDGANTDIGTVDTLDVADLVNNGTLVQGETISCIVTPNDGYEDGDGDSAAVTVNNIPLISTVTLSDDPIVSTQDTTLTCTIDRSDVDGHTVTSDFVWKDGAGTPFVTSSTAGTDQTIDVQAYVNNGTLDEGEEVVCEVTPDDGLESGDAKNADTNINNRPVIDAMAITFDIDAYCNVGLSDDADGDGVTFTYRWTVNGGGNHTGNTLSITYFGIGDQLICYATPNDGIEDGTDVTDTEAMNIWDAEVTTADPDGGYTTTTKNSRGLHFVAPVDFTLTQLAVPHDYSSNAMQVIQVVRFN